MPRHRFCFARLCGTIRKNAEREYPHVSQDRLDHRSLFRHRPGVCLPVCQARFPPHPHRPPPGAAAELLAKYNTFCRVLPADLARESECTRLCEELAEERIDIFINNAGFGVCGSFLETSTEAELSMAKVNVLAMHQLCKFAVQKMQAQGFGTVLNVASSAGLLPGGPYRAGYYATKAYVVSLTRGIAEELREQHSPVYVCALCPGPVDTEFNDRAGVVFALKGISPALCVEEAMRGMLRGKTIIVPSALMRAATTAQHFVPTPLLMPIMARQQKKKLGGSTPTQEH